MRLAFAASAVCLGLIVFGAARAPSDPVANPPTTPNDAAAKHTKRTACLKEAKAKKLVGVNKSAYVQRCITARADPAIVGAVARA